MVLHPKRVRPPHIRHCIESECEIEAEKEAQSRKLHRMQELLSSGGSGMVDNG